MENVKAGLKPVVLRSSQKPQRALRWSEKFQKRKNPSSAVHLTLSSWADSSTQAVAGPPPALGPSWLELDAFVSPLKATVLLRHEQRCSFSSLSPSRPKSFSFSTKCSKCCFGWKFPFPSRLRWPTASASPSLPRSGQDRAVPPLQLRSSRCWRMAWWVLSSPPSLVLEKPEAMAAASAPSLVSSPCCLQRNEHIKDLSMGGGRRTSGEKLQSLLDVNFREG